jgi:hypothetical protein
MGDVGEGTLLPRKKKVIVKQRKLKSGHGPHWGPSTKMNWPRDHWSQYNLNLHHCTANYTPILSTERVPYMKKKVIVTRRNVTSDHLLQKGHDSKTNWPTDCQSQYNLIDRGLRYTVCTWICMLNICNVNTYIYVLTNVHVLTHDLKMQTLTDNRQTRPLVRE